MMDKKITKYTDHRTAPMPGFPWVMFQTWEDVFAMHVPVDIEVLDPHVPDELKLDSYGGQAWISIFPFYLRNLSLRGLPRFPYFHKFLELNVRTYVSYKGIPGVYFFSLDAEKIIPVLGARTATLPYFKARMSRTDTDGWMTYSSRRQFDGAAYFNAKYKVTSDAKTAAPDTLDHWLFERYRLYKTIGNRVVHISIHHLPWKLAKVSFSYDGDSINSMLPGNIEGTPAVAHYSPGLDTLFWPLVKS